MFSSEKVLQMSYANYQWALFFIIYTQILSANEFISQGQRGAGRKIQKFLYHGRTRILAPQNLLLYGV